MSWLRGILGKSNRETIRNAIISEKMEQKETLVDRISRQKRRPTWFGHVTRLGNGRLPIIPLNSQVDGIRDRGKPTKTWMENNSYTVEDIKAQGMDIREATGERYRLGDFSLGPHRRQTRDGGENWNWIAGTDSIQCYRTT